MSKKLVQQICENYVRIVGQLSIVVSAGKW